MNLKDKIRESEIKDLIDDIPRQFSKGYIGIQRIC